MVLRFILLFIACYFCNLMEVYHIQGCLKEQRTKKWWQSKVKNSEDKNEEADNNGWIPCLIAHALEWCFISMIPLAIYGYSRFGFENEFWWYWIAVFVFNTIVHYVIDIFKTHYDRITWSVDQALHCLQIIIMVIVLGRF